MSFVVIPLISHWEGLIYCRYPLTVRRFFLTVYEYKIEANIHMKLSVVFSIPSIFDCLGLLFVPFSAHLFCGTKVQLS